MRYHVYLPCKNRQICRPTGSQIVIYILIDRTQENRRLLTERYQAFPEFNLLLISSWIQIWCFTFIPNLWYIIKRFVSYIYVLLNVSSIIIYYDEQLLVSALPSRWRSAHCQLSVNVYSVRVDQNNVVQPWAVDFESNVPFVSGITVI
jgi:hypothetical protein